VSQDIFDVKGVKTSCGNRAYYKLYPEAANNAYPVQKLIDAGAIVVGKMRTAQFANSDSPTTNSVDFLNPFNPRAEGYQSPSGSSSGPAAGVAAYEWLDFSMGSDTGGSIRGPAASQGLYALRPTQNITLLTDTMPLSPILDTCGLFARNPELLTKASAALYGSNFTLGNSYPEEILTIGFNSTSTTETDLALNSFLAKLQSFLKVQNTTVFNYTTAWAATGPQGAPPLPILLNETYTTLVAIQQKNLVGNLMFRDYAAKHDGRTPFLNPSPLLRWTWANSTTNTLDQAVANKTMFSSWLQNIVLPRDPVTCSRTLLVLNTAVRLNYRNIPLPAAALPLGFSTSSFSNLGGVPDTVVPGK
jgi:hypothetical protein